MKGSFYGPVFAYNSLMPPEHDLNLDQVCRFPWVCVPPLLWMLWVSWRLSGSIWILVLICRLVFLCSSKGKDSPHCLRTKNAADLMVFHGSGYLFVLHLPPAAGGSWPAAIRPVPHRHLLATSWEQLVPPSATSGPVPCWKSWRGEGLIGSDKQATFTHRQVLLMKRPH